MRVRDHYGIFQYYYDRISEELDLKLVKDGKTGQIDHLKPI